MQTETDKERLINRILLGLITFLLVIIVFGSIFYLRSTRPMNQARREAIAIAEKQADIEEVQDFFWFTRENTYFTVIGKNKDGEQMAVIIPKSGKSIKVFPMTDGIDSAEAQKLVVATNPNLSVSSVRLGLYKDQPVWEVAGSQEDGKRNFYLIAFKDGEEVKTIENI